MTTTTEPQTVNTALVRLLNDANQRGWTPDNSRGARRGCWHDEDRTSEFTVTTANDLGLTRVDAHTPASTLKICIGEHDHELQAVDLLRRFLGWTEDAP